MLNTNVFKILNYGKTFKTLLTNGTLLDQITINRLKKCKKLNELKISLDGFNGHDKIRVSSKSSEIIKNINSLDLLTHIPFSISTIVTKYNLDELIDLYEYIKNTNAYRWEIDFPFIQGRAKKQKEILINDSDQYRAYKIFLNLINKYLKEKPGFVFNIMGIFNYFLVFNEKKFCSFDLNTHPCDYNLKGLTVKINGDVSLCPSLPLTFGNVKNCSLKSVINGVKYKNFLKLKVKNIKGCVNCQFLNICGGGCRADVILSGGTLYDKDPTSCKRVLFWEKNIPLLSRKITKVYEKLFNLKNIK